MKMPVPAVAILLAACAAPPMSDDDQTIENFVSNFSGREMRLHFPMPVSDSSIGTSALSGARDTVFGYSGLKQAYAPAYRHCEAAGGMLHIAEQRAFSKTGPNLPARFQCRANDKLVWEFSVHYIEKISHAEKSARVVSLMPQASLSSAADLASRRVSRDANPKPEQRLPEKDKAKPRTDVAEKPAGEQTKKTTRGDELKLFRKNLKAGDRVQWKAGDMPAKSVGKVVRLDGDLALVQFDNQSSTGQSMRYFNRAQLEPFGGIMPVRSGR